MYNYNVLPCIKGVHSKSPSLLIIIATINDWEYKYLVVKVDHNFNRTKRKAPYRALCFSSCRGPGGL